MKKSKHVHKWKKTGNCLYTCPTEYEFQCKCGKRKWVEDPSTGIKKLSLTEEEMREKYPQFFKK